MFGVKNFLWNIPPSPTKKKNSFQTFVTMPLIYFKILLSFLDTFSTMGRRGMPGRRRHVLQLDENTKTSYLSKYLIFLIRF